MKVILRMHLHNTKEVIYCITLLGGVVPWFLPRKIYISLYFPGSHTCVEMHLISCTKDSYRFLGPWLYIVCHVSAWCTIYGWLIIAFQTRLMTAVQRQTQLLLFVFVEHKKNISYCFLSKREVKAV